MTIPAMMQKIISPSRTLYIFTMAVTHSRRNGLITMKITVWTGATMLTSQASFSIQYE